ncbi:MAG: low affinity iron permease family protein [Polyangiaceae bacterium]|nr:low affinity iron permease family protein [Polyangiaceae bacterium]
MKPSHVVAAGHHPRRTRATSRKREHVVEPPRSTVSDVFRHLSNVASNKFGSHWAFIAAVALIIGWAATGPFFHYSDVWQLVINTTTTIITFLMVFLIQSTQNRDAKAVHLKLDELIRATRARNAFADLEDATQEELDAFQHEFERLRRRADRRQT